MQKALEQMNVKLPEVVSDITGLTGISIIEAILQGERDPIKLAKLRDGALVITAKTRLPSRWKERGGPNISSSFVKRTELHRFPSDADYRVRSADSGRTRGSSRIGREKTQTVNPRKRGHKKNDVRFDAEGDHYSRRWAVDLTLIEGIDVGTALW